MFPRCSTVLLLAAGVTLVAFTNAGSIPVSLELTDSVIVCPDKSQCSGGSTCCLKSDGLYGCCAYKNAVCCASTHHCCPSNSLCHADGCVADESGVTNSQKLIEAVRVNKQSEMKIESAPNLICPDGSSCPGLCSCCLSSVGYRCCPYDFGVCCPGGLTCCPSGTRCGAGSTCIKSDREGNSAVLFIQAIQTQSSKKSQLY